MLNIIRSVTASVVVASGCFTGCQDGDVKPSGGEILMSVSSFEAGRELADDPKWMLVIVAHSPGTYVAHIHNGGVESTDVACREMIAMPTLHREEVAVLMRLFPLDGNLETDALLAKSSVTPFPASTEGWSFEVGRHTLSLAASEFGLSEFELSALETLADANYRYVPERDATLDSLEHEAMKLVQAWAAEHRPECKL